MFAQFYVSFRSSSSSSAHGEEMGKEGRWRRQSNDDNDDKGEEEEEEEEKGTLHCLLYQRSCDIGLGVPFNIASYALLTHMLAHICDLVPGTFTHTMGDAHVYLDHVDALRQQIERQPRPFPTLEIGTRKDVIGDKQNGHDGEGEDEGNKLRSRTIDGWRPEDFAVKGYEPHKGIAMKMSV